MTHPLEVAYAAWLAQEETKRQQNVILARNYYNGEQNVPLTERQKAFLGFNAPESRFALNYCGIVVNAVAERMIVERFSTDTNNEALEEWAKNLWRENRMDQHQQEVHEGTVCDAEHFVIVDWDEEAERPRLSPHPRYTDPTVDGDGFGCKAHYPDNDPTQPMRYASKRWTETTWDGTKRATTLHMNLYYPDRVEWYILVGGGGTTDWQLDHIEPWTVGSVTPGVYDDDGNWWPNEAAEPRGIPVFHFLNPDKKSELWNAVPIQDAINKTALDILGAADSAGFPILVAKGWEPTTDGKAPESDGSNYLKIHPGMILGPMPVEGGVERILPADLAPMLNTLDSLIFKLAQVTGTPVTRFMTSRQIAAEGTLKQQEEPLLAKIRTKQVPFGNCLHGKTKIVLADGSTEMIERLVKNRIPADVLAVSPEGHLVTARIINWYRNPRRGRHMLGITYVSKPYKSYRPAMYVTEDHHVLLRRGWTAASDVVSGIDEIATGEPSPNHDQMDVILGGMLGDMHLDRRRKNGARIIMVHSGAQREWIELKRAALAAFSMGHIGERPNPRSERSLLRCQSRAWTALSKLQEKFYPDGGDKMVPKELVEDMGVLGLATWYLDDGCLKHNSYGRGNPYSTIATCSFTEDDVQWLCEWLQRKWGIEARMLMSDGYRYIFPTVEGTRRLCQLVGRYIPPSMRYKLVDGSPEYDPWLWDTGAAEVFYDTAIVTGAPPAVYSRKSVYDIEVEGIHNFVTLGGVAHNCWEDALSMARQLDNEFGGAGLDEKVLFETEWKPAETRDKMADDKAFWEAAGAARRAGCPLPVWLELQGWDEAKIARVTESDEYKAREAQAKMGMMVARGGIGG